jgi:hypothetical protein
VYMCVCVYVCMCVGCIGLFTLGRCSVQVWGGYAMLYAMLLCCYVVVLLLPVSVCLCASCFFASLLLCFCVSVLLFLCSSVPLFLCSSVPLCLCASVPLCFCTLSNLSNLSALCSYLAVSALFPPYLHASMLHAICYMLYAICYMLYAIYPPSLSGLPLRPTAKGTL